MTSWDPVSRKLSAVAPIADERLAAAFEKYEGMTIAELEAECLRVEDAFKAWVQHPDNEGKPIQLAPMYVDRIAVDSLRERRIWWE